MERRLRCFAVGAGAVAAAIGVVCLLAWLSGAMTYRGLSSLTIKTNASLCLILCGTALMQAVPADPSPLLRWTARCFAAICLVVGGLTVMEYLPGWELAIDQLLAVEPPGAVGVVSPNRMGPPAAVSFILGGIAILFLLHTPRPLVRQSQWIGIILCLIALLGLLGYIYGTGTFHGVSSYTSVAWPTAIAIAFLGAGLLCARPKEGLMVSITSADAGGVAIRRLLAAAILVPIALGWLHLQGESHGLYGRISGTSFLVITWIVIFSWLVHQTAKRLFRADEAKRSALTALQRTQALLLEAERLSHTGAWEWDLTSDIWTFSDEWQRLHGTRDRSLCPDELVSIAHPEDRPAIRSAFDALRGGVSPYEMEHRIVRQDTGEVRTVKASGQYLRDRSGRVVKIYGFVQDITEQKRAEDELRKSEARLSTALDNLREGVVIATEGGEVFYWNPSGWMMHGFASPEEGRRHLAEFEQIFQLSLADGRVLTLDEWPMPRIIRGEKVQNVELVLRRMDQEWERVVSYSGTILQTLGGERLVYLSIYDMTEQRRAEEALLEREERLGIFIEHAPAALAMFDRQMCYLHVSRRWLTDYGLEGRHLRGMSHYQVFPEISDHWRQIHARALAGEVLRADEEQFVRSDGSIQWFRWEVRPWHDASGRVAGILVFSEDITHRKHAEQERERLITELQRSNAELQQFAYVSSHDLQEPIRMVTSYVQLLQKRYQGKLDEKAEMYISFIVEAAHRMSSLINDLLALSRVGRREREFMPVETELVVKEALDNLRVAMEESGARITKDPLPMVMGDPVQLLQLFQNLIGNAIKYRKKEVTPEVQISAERKKNQWLFGIHDNGIGIEPQYHDKIFVIFQRLHQREEYQGTGIGLAICQKIVENHGGMVWVESTPGEGSTFYFTLPAEG
ncbi:PAS domain-containing sensor histidine kinase [Geotalea toluenoxydans]